MYNEIFLKDSEHSNHWHNRASDLKAAAGVLYYGMSEDGSFIRDSLGYSQGYCMETACLHPYYLICGLSIEAILKYQLCKLNKFSPVPKTHDMLHLVHKLNLDLSDMDRKKLDYLSVHISWAGRYPYPNKNNSEQWEKYMDLHNAIFFRRVTDNKLSEDFENKSTDALGELEWEDFSRIWYKIEAF